MGQIRRKKKQGSKVQTKGRLDSGKNKGRDQWELQLREMDGVPESAQEVTEESQGLIGINFFLLDSMESSKTKKDREATEKVINSLAQNNRKSLELKPEQA